MDYVELENRGLRFFDAWTAQFGEVVSSLELAPEGTGYRYRNRFAKFVNLPELLSMRNDIKGVNHDLLVRSNLETVFNENANKMLKEIMQLPYIPYCSEPAKEIPKPKEKSALNDMTYNGKERQNYKQFQLMYPEIISGQYDYMSFKAECYNNLYIEKIGTDTYAYCQYYIQEGDLMCDPEFTFKLDQENKAIRILTYQLDGLGLYQEIYDRENSNLFKPHLKKELDDLLDSNMRDITHIPYKLVKAKNDEEEFEFLAETEDEELEV